MPESIDESPPKVGLPLAARRARDPWLQIPWGATLLVLVAPCLWWQLTYVLRSWHIRQTPGSTVPLVGLIGGAIITLVAVGLRRNWPASNTGWLLLFTYLVASGGMFMNLIIRQNAAASLDKSVLGNARQISAAADQYYLEYGHSSVQLKDLIGATTYIKALHTIENESYPTYYTKDVTLTITGVAGLRTITYSP